MAGPDPEEIEFYDKSMMSLERYFEGNDAYQAGIHQNVDAAPCKTATAPAHFWPAGSSTVEENCITRMGGPTMDQLPGGHEGHFHSTLLPEFGAQTNNQHLPNTDAYRFGKNATYSPVYVQGQHYRFQQPMLPYTDPSQPHFDPICKPPPGACQPHPSRRSPNATHEEASDPLRYAMFHGAESNHTFAPLESEFIHLHQDPWNMLPQPSHYYPYEAQNPGTPFEDAQETIPEQPLLTPTIDEESNQSFHTAAGDVDADGIALASLATLRSSADLGDGVDDIGIFYCQSCNITLWDDFEYTRHLRTHARNFPCRHLGCTRRFQSSQELARHARAHDRTYHCTEPRCSSSFAFEKDLIRHRETKHGSKRPHKCPDPYCKFAKVGFKRKDNLKRHIQNAHSGCQPDRN